MRRLLLLLLVPLWAVSGCGTSADNAAAVHRAVGATRAARTASVAVQLHAAGFTTGALDITATGDVDLGGGRAALTIDAQGTRVATRLIGPTLYVQRDGTWYSVDARSASALGNLPLGNLDPAAALTAAAGVQRGRVQLFGHDTVAGVRTRHYRARTDDGTLDVWIDGHDLVRRVTRPLPTPGNADAEATGTVELRDFGKSVSIDAPAGAQPIDG